MTIRRTVSLICTISMIFFGIGGFAYAEPADTSAASDSDNVEIVSVDSAAEAAEAVPAENNDKFYEVDLTSGDVKSNDGKVEDGFEMIYGESYSDSGLEDMSKANQKQQIEKMTDDSELYSLNNIEGNTAEVTSNFATCRLMVRAEKVSNTYGAVSGVSLSGLCILKYENEQATADAYKALCDEYGKDRVLADIPFKAQTDMTESAVNGSDTGTNWSYDYMQFDTAAEPLALTGDDVTVAVLDSGIMTDHKAFEGTYLRDSYNFVDCNENVTDVDGHGTVVASVIAQSTGLNVSIMPIKVLDDNGEGSEVDMQLGLFHAEEHGAKIANVSFGASVNEEYLDSLESVFHDYNGVIITAAGNNKSIIENTHFWPAVSDRTLSVSSLKSIGESTAAFDSSYSNYGSKLDYTAPGTGIYGAALDAEYSFKYFRGTSFAAPHVSAAAALIMSNDKTIDTQEEMVAALNGICKDEGEAGFDIYCGNGCPILSKLEIKEPNIDDTEDYEVQTTTDPTKPTVAPTQATKPTQTTKPTQAPKISITKAKASVPAKTYTGKKLKPVPTVTYSGKTLKNGTDFTLSYKNNKKVGNATVTLTGKGRYTGSKSISFKINPKGTALKKPARGKKSLTIKWKKQSAKMSSSRITGYQIQLATNSKFTKNVKNVYVKGYAKKSKKVKKLKGKTKYYVHVRTYKTVNGANFYSPWSKTKSVKTKK